MYVHAFTVTCAVVKDKQLFFPSKQQSISYVCTCLFVGFVYDRCCCPGKTNQTLYITKYKVQKRKREKEIRQFQFAFVFYEFCASGLIAKLYKQRIILHTNSSIRNKFSYSLSHHFAVQFYFIEIIFPTFLLSI